MEMRAVGTRPATVLCREPKGTPVAPTIGLFSAAENIIFYGRKHSFQALKVTLSGLDGKSDSFLNNC